MEMTPQSKKMLIDNQAKKPLDKIISRKKEFNVQIQTHNKKSNSISYKSIKRISTLSNKTPEGIMSLLQTETNSMSVNKQIDSKENEDSFIEAMQSEKKPIYILDSNDCDIDRQLRNYALRHELVEQEIEQRILKEKMSNSQIARNYYCVNYWWEFSYMFILVMSIFLTGHLILFNKHSNIENNLYNAILGITIITIIIAGVISIINFNNRKSICICSSFNNMLLITPLLLVIFILWYAHIVFPKDMLDYLNEMTYFNSLMRIIFVALMLLLIFNYKMKEFFDEYVSYLPMKYERIPNNRELNELEGYKMIVNDQFEYI